MDPQWITAACAAAGLLITWTTSIAGAAIWLMRRLDGIKKEILTELNTKHDANQQRYDALAVLVTRHDTILDPEFSDNGTGRVVRGRQ